MLEDISEPTGPAPVAVSAAVTTAPVISGLASTATATTITTSSSQETQLKDAVATRAKYLYFAYGSNLSPTQMRQRCIYNPDISARPLAIARLDGWKWIICERGYANVLPPNSISSPAQSKDGDGDQESHSDDVVYGVLYEMTREDENLLDGYEGVDHSAPPAPPDAPVGRDKRPNEQGNGSYNKWYVSATVVEWLADEEVEGSKGLRGKEEQKVLVYVDEHRVTEGPPKKEYIARMNRGIREAEALGLPVDWVQRVMRKFIPEGPDAGIQN
ncbi:hypothetical protein AJ79_07668 [Helicocarpus griseus UAMH5409]|uniref:gamma-glutamylcyclotransferase n=1 Tax=Helicocarpus griseus UAMH5409 TaxID=1447875 RepID=A0A2B7X0X8_9EURO|nr:hypothetical protein AJ79_07668 [Helicocarpus griseus UAMH5409]